jgi:hypothetical protein
MFHDVPIKTDECGKPNDEPHPSHRIIPLYTLQLDGPISKTWDSSIFFGQSKGCQSYPNNIYIYLL